MRGTGRPLLRYKDICKRDLKALDINEPSWESSAADRDEWRRTLKRKLPEGECNLIAGVAAKRAKRKEIAEANVLPVLPSAFICPICGRDCKAGIGLLSHTNKCRAYFWLHHPAHYTYIFIHTYFYLILEYNI